MYMLEENYKQHKITRHAPNCPKFGCVEYHCGHVCVSLLFTRCPTTPKVSVAVEAAH